MSIRAASSILRVLRAIYDVEQERERWLANVMQALMSSDDRGAGVGGVLYDASRADRLPIEAIHGVGLSDGWQEAGLAIHQDAVMIPLIGAAYRSRLCATLADLYRVAHVKSRISGSYALHRVGGQIMINGFDCSGKGCVLYLFSERPVSLTPLQRDIFARLATHLATGYRLQRQLASPVRESSSRVGVVLTPTGLLDHVDTDGHSRDAIATLQEAVRFRERAMRVASVDPYRSLRQSRGLVDAHWTLVDSYEYSGKRYIVARENAPKPKGMASLSVRERQVVALAGLGRTNKMIAYELGLAHSTVRVLMARAAAKLGTTTRRDLVARGQSDSI